MDTNPSVQQPRQPSAAPSAGIFGTKMPSTIAFAIGALLFLLPFVDIRCNEVSIMKVTGLQLATGFEVKNEFSESLERRFEGIDDETAPRQQTRKDRQKPNTFAIIALVLGVAGLALSFSNARTGGRSGLITGLLSSLSLVGLFIDIKRNAGDNPFDEKIISVTFTAGFYLALIAFIAAAYFGYRRWKADYR